MDKPVSDVILKNAFVYFDDEEQDFEGCHHLSAWLHFEGISKGDDIDLLWGQCVEIVEDEDETKIFYERVKEHAEMLGIPVHEFDWTDLSNMWLEQEERGDDNE